MLLYVHIMLFSFLLILILLPEGEDKVVQLVNPHKFLVFLSGLLLSLGDGVVHCDEVSLWCPTAAVLTWVGYRTVVGHLAREFVGLWGALLLLLFRLRYCCLK